MATNNKNINKKPSFEEASVQIYKIHLIQWVKLDKGDRNYLKEEEYELAGDIVLTVNGTIEECIEIAKRKYPKSILLDVEIYNPSKKEGVKNV